MMDLFGNFEKINTVFESLSNLSENIIGLDSYSKLLYLYGHHLDL